MPGQTVQKKQKTKKHTKKTTYIHRNIHIYIQNRHESYKHFTTSEQL